ncbi:MAG: hypothetical protein ACK5P6_04750 [Pseudobdellovibrionaceae bacterium]
MKFRVYLKMLLFCAGFLSPVEVLAQKIDFEQFSTDKIEVLSPSHPAMQSVDNVPFLMKVLEQEKYKWPPQGKLSRLPSAQCQSLKGDFTTWAQQIENCDPEIQSGWNNFLVNTLGSMWIQFDVFKHAYAHHVLFHLPGGVKLKGYLGLKDTSQARPLIIIRAGVFSTMSQFFPERFLFQQLFEQSPFNVLLLESLSGAEYNARNQRSAFGGFEEGQQNFLVARLFKDSRQPLSKLVSEIHLLGTSMGGHGMYYAALLNEYQKPQARPFSSFMGICPLTDFQNTFEFHESQGFSLALVDSWARGRLKILSERYPEIDRKHFFKSASQVLANLYTEPLLGWLSPSADFQLPASYLELKTQRLEGKLSPADFFWKANHFWPAFKDVRTPILILASANDPLVPYPLNSRKIKERFWDLGSSQVQVASLSQGFHCSNGIAYDWWSHSRLLQDYFLKMSRSRLVKKSVVLRGDSAAGSASVATASASPGVDLVKKKKASLPVELANPGGAAQNFQDFLAVRNPQQLSLEFEMPMGSENLEYRLRISASPEKSETQVKVGSRENPESKEKLDPSSSPNLIEVTGVIPLALLDFQNLGPVKERAHQQMILRWAYHNIILNSDSSALEWLVWKP